MPSGEVVGQLVERTLRRLQQAIREGESAQDEDDGFMLKGLAKELVDEHGDEVLRLSGRARRAFQEAQRAVDPDLRFEHLKDVEAAVWLFVGRAWKNRRADHVPWFVERFGEAPVTLPCYFSVEHLTVPSEVEVSSVRLLPLADSSIPTASSRIALIKPGGCVAVAEVVGTNRQRMAARGRARVEHALRILRTALGDFLDIADEQLRFVVGTTYAFGDNAAGWRQRDDVAYKLGLNDELMELVREHPVFILQPEPATKVDRAADLAMRWMERARMTGEPLVTALYLIFAVEALLGDKAAGEKGHKIALRQAMLSHVAAGGFRHPSDFVVLYEEVRSAAVHGSAFRPVTKREAGKLFWAVKDTLREYLTVAREGRFTKQSQLAGYLDAHPDQPELVAWLRSRGGLDWAKYFDSRDSPSDRLVVQ